MCVCAAREVAVQSRKWKMENGKGSVRNSAAASSSSSSFCISKTLKINKIAVEHKTLVHVPPLSLLIRLLLRQ